MTAGESSNGRVRVHSGSIRSGKQTTGTIPADNRAVAMDLVVGRGLSPISIEEQRSANGKQQNGNKPPPTRVPQSAIETFTRELANLLGAGLPLSRALHLLRRESASPAAKYIWGKVHDDVVGGKPLADSLAKWPKAFSSVYIAMVRAGESGGFLPIVLQQIADFRTRESDLKGKVKAALVYPCVLGVFACAVLIFLLTFFIPRFSGIFASFGADLPFLTQIVVAISTVVIHYGIFVAIALVFGIIAARRAMMSDSGRRMIERAILKMPVVGKVSARFALVRFSRMLGTLVGAGVPLISALRTARESLGNQTLADAVGHATIEVQREARRYRREPRRDAGFVSRLPVVEMVAIAEETGRLDKELLRLSLSYEGELDRSLRMLVALAEPLMLFVTAVLIGIVVVAMLLPILTLSDVVK